VTVTIKDIARSAGVSHPTVSRALHDDPLVAAETAARIHRIAAELGYVPSATARSLKTNRSRVLGVIVNRISDPFYSEVLDGIQDVLHAAGYSLFLASSNHNLDRGKAIARAMAERRVDGLIVCSMFVSTSVRMELSAFGAPLVVVHNRDTDTGGHAIYHDDRYGSRQMTRHLIDLGHKRIAFVGNARGGRETEDRLTGFSEEMHDAGLSVPPEYVVHAPTGQLTSAPQAVQPLLDSPLQPTALVCFNDMIAIGAMQRLQQAGWSVPADCSVVGFDNISFSNFVTPPLTTFNQPKYLLGEEAAHMMLQLLTAKARKESTESPNIVTMRGEILVRASTAPPPAR
jgi:DNA-binding LacI/PurR family transcriptional regulator